MVGLTLVALLAGRAATSDPSAAPGGGSPASTSPAVATHGAIPGTSEEANRTLAERAVATMMAAVPLPPRSEPTTSEPDALASAAPQPAPGDGTARARRIWRVAQPVSAVRTWLREHPPKGLRDSGTGGYTEGDGADVSSWYWSLDTSGDLRDAVGRAELTVSVVPVGGSSTALRADALAWWLVPTPWRDEGGDDGRPTVRVTTSTPCPSVGTVDAAGTVENPGPAGEGLDTALLPDAVPVGGVACLYGADLATGAGDRTARHTVSAPEAAELAAGVRSLVLGHTVIHEVHSCPMPPVRTVLLDLVYADGRQVDLWVSPVCSGVRNGRIAVDGDLDFDWLRWVPQWKV